MEIRNLDVFLNDTDIDSVRLNTPDINSFVFDCINHGSEEEMYKDIADFIKMLLKYENTCKIYLDEKGIVVVEYGHDNRADYWGSPNLKWVTDEETDLLDDFRTDIVADVMSQAQKEVPTEEDDCCECCDPYPGECNCSK